MLLLMRGLLRVIIGGGENLTRLHERKSVDRNESKTTVRVTSLSYKMQGY